MHKTRILTGLVLGLLCIWSIFGFNLFWFGALCVVLISLGCWEWLALCRVQVLWAKALYLVVFWAVTALAWHHLMLALWLAVGWWCLAFCLLLVPLEKTRWLRQQWLMLLLGIVVISPAWFASMLLHQHSRVLLLYAILVVTLADTAAYFVGSHFGKHRLAPSISPKKSIEGLLGGLVVSMIAAVITSIFVPAVQGWLGYVGMLALAVVGVFASVVGDLFESVIKRQCDVKDSGTLLPGHGGVLDRLDSLCAGMPVIALACVLFQLF